MTVREVDGKAIVDTLVDKLLEIKAKTLAHLVMLPPRHY